MADKGFRFNTYQSERETHQHIGYQLKRIADAMEQDNTQATPLKCSFCSCVDPNAIQMQAVGMPGNMQPVCEYCYGKLQEAGEAAEIKAIMESFVAAGIVERSEGDSTDDDA